MNDMQAEIDRLKNQPPAPTAAPQTQTFTPGVNPVTTARARATNPQHPNVLYEDNPPPAGSVNIKGTKPPPSFMGDKRDARPFLDRIGAYFALLPVSYRLTRNRILFTCSLITSRPADSWAIAVTNALVNEKDGESYCDDWQAFKDVFLASFGVPNEKEEAIFQLSSLVQDKMDFNVFVAEFQRLYELSGIPEPMGIREFKRSVDKSLFFRVSTENPTEPASLDEWITKARAWDIRLKSVATYAAQNRRHQPPPSKTFGSWRPQAPNPAFRATPAYRTPHQRDPNAMDVDAMSSRDTRIRQPLSQATRQVTILPRPSTSSASRPAPVSNSGVCYRCQKPGHFKNNCPVPFEHLDKQHIRTMFETALAFADGQVQDTMPEEGPEPVLEYEQETLEEVLEDGYDEKDF
jgi:hypothetical protein